MFPIKLQLDKRGALYEQLARALKQAILEGQLSAGERLPSTRALAAELNISRNTVLSAYEKLRAEQHLTMFDRSGTRVALGAKSIDTSPIQKIAEAPSRYADRLRKLAPVYLARRETAVRYDLHYGEPLSDQRLFHAWRRRLSAAALAAGPYYPDPKGFMPLRRTVAEYLARRRGVTCTENDIIIVGGTQQAVTLIARVVLNEGEEAAIEDPCYQCTMQAIKAHGAHIVNIRTDTDGMVISELEKRNPRLICVTPTHQFPSGAMLSLERRIELIQFATRRNSWILEDDYDSEFQYDKRRLPPIRALDVSGRVIHTGSFSKTLFPSLRLGYVVCPPGIRRDLQKAKYLDDSGSPVTEQAALAAFMQSRQFDSYLKSNLQELRLRRNTLIEGLKKYAGEHIDIIDTQAGMHLVVWFRNLDYMQLDQLIDLGLKRGLGLYPMHPHYQKPPKRPGLILGYANLSAGSLSEACALLGQCLNDLRIGQH